MAPCGLGALLSEMAPKTELLQRPRLPGRPGGRGSETDLGVSLSRNPSRASARSGSAPTVLLWQVEKRPWEPARWPGCRAAAFRTMAPGPEAEEQQALPGARSPACGLGSSPALPEASL